MTSEPTQAEPGTTQAQRLRAGDSALVEKNRGIRAEELQEGVRLAGQRVSSPIPAEDVGLFLLVEGDVVRLKTGGPLMAVKFKIDALLLCIWTDPKGRTQRETFAPEQLELVGRESPAWLLALSRLSSRWNVVAIM